MAASRSSSERTGSIQSQDSPKILNSKADPNTALYEAQPSRSSQSPTSLTVPLLNPSVAVNTQPTDRDLFSLRSIQHKDRNGQIISDPDLSNPTRARLERPLDTIRSFEAAIDAERKQNRM
ncbi:uncharacterized protein N7498_004440 [Penicillium cinerascens]|uniref:Uncharacterized protein n=1 Tax=Penicillium cinerascens TaxID=70096 RepID=A0A9W9T828_9EURO|nr:uncharacterized protein N7498_004440 [Penicillium cinerascens]KAJ5212794.1 hypothetical protein N7498_004440 [Penicillium cinerascens]